MRLLPGKKIADDILFCLKQNIVQEKLRPELAAFLVGKNPESKLYVSLKKNAARKAGIIFHKIDFAANVKESEVLKKVEALNKDPEISGIIVQLPLPNKFNTQKIINAISPEKDADGFHPENLKLFFENKVRLWPAFPKAIIELLASSGEKIENKKAVIVAKSDTFGKTMQKALEYEEVKGEYVLLNSISQHKEKILQADIIISACGVPGIIKGEMIKKGAIIIDGGIAKKGRKVLGDVDFESVKNIASLLSPVPGGVGPVTIACLLENVYQAEKALLEKKI